MALYLHCAVCSRKQANGLLSGAAWGKAPVPPGAVVDHPAVRDGHVRACPDCVGRHREWHIVALTAVGVSVAAL